MVKKIDREEFESLREKSLKERDLMPIIDHCPFCGRKHKGFYVICVKCGALICDRCDIWDDGEKICEDCRVSDSSADSSD